MPNRGSGTVLAGTALNALGGSYGSVAVPVVHASTRAQATAAHNNRISSQRRSHRSSLRRGPRGGEGGRPALVDAALVSTPALRSKRSTSAKVRSGRLIFR